VFPADEANERIDCGVFQEQERRGEGVGVVDNAGVSVCKGERLPLVILVSNIA
jgi:hypothetical protein